MSNNLPFELTSDSLKSTPFKKSGTHKTNIVIDIETDGLISTKIHVMSIGYLATTPLFQFGNPEVTAVAASDKDSRWKIYSTSDTEEMKSILKNKNYTVVGHYFKQFDVVELERVLDFKIEAEIIDTLPLAWYIYPERKRRFGLEYFGEDYGIEKPKIDDWVGLPYEDYKFRCEQDVRVNIILWEDIREKLINLYGSWEDAYRLVRNLMFKMGCLVDQQQSRKCKIDVEKTQNNLKHLTDLLEEKAKLLIEVMPPGKVIKTKPKVMKKQDGSLSSHGQKWFDYLKEKGLSEDTYEIRDKANPASDKQVKEWLFSLGWVPKHFKKTDSGQVPQVKDESKQLCKSVSVLQDREPAIAALDDFSVLGHRIGILKAFSDKKYVDEKGFTVAAAAGFTNTLRLRHKKPIVNLPKVKTKYGKEIRECIVATKEHLLCGSDISQLENQTKCHYQWFYDPEYVAEQQVKGYDSHLDLALRAEDLTQVQVDEHKLYVKSKRKKGVDHTSSRDKYKTANYSCIYGTGYPGLARKAGIPQREARKLLNAYWDRNWSIKEVVADSITKTIKNQLWLHNPVSKFWYSVRNKKDIFSVLNQGTGAFVFDKWILVMNSEGLFPILQYHDEVLLNIKPKEEAQVEKTLKDCMVRVNNSLKLNIEIQVDVEFGKTYADVH